VSAAQAATLGGGSDATEQFSANVGARFQRGEPLIVLITGLVIMIVKLLRRVLTSATVCRPLLHVAHNVWFALTGRRRKLRVRERVHHAASYSDALAERRVVGVLSYNILANPVYQRIFQMKDDRHLLEEEEAVAEAEDADAEGVAADGAADGPASKPSKAGSRAGDSNGDASTVASGAAVVAPLSVVGGVEAGAASARRVEPAAASDAGASQHTLRHHNSSHHHQPKGYQSLKEALNIKKGSAVSTVRDRSVWKDAASSTASTGTKVSSLFPGKRPADASAGGGSALSLAVAPVAGEDARSAKSGGAKSTRSAKAPKQDLARPESAGSATGSR